jgi:Domain of unknown function (DUF4169)
VVERKIFAFAERNILFDAIKAHWRGFLNDDRAAWCLFCKSTLSIHCMMGASMGDVVNLKRFKKRTKREQSAKQAAANRARFGRTKSERAVDERRVNRANDLLDQHRIDGEDAS